MLHAFRNNSMALILVTALTVSARADKADQEPRRGKPDAKAAQATSKIETELGKLFKAWDKNKDASVSKEELEKFYAKLKAPAKKKPGQPAAEQPDPLAPVFALHGKLDADKDGAIGSAEFDGWAPTFARHLAEFAQVQEELNVKRRELAEIQAQLQKSRGVSAADGIAAGIFQRHASEWKVMVKQLEDKEAELAKGDHAEYQDFIYRELAQRIKR